jgi:hypothetical protein
MAFLLAKAGAPSLAFLLAPQVSSHQILAKNGVILYS